MEPLPGSDGLPPLPHYTLTPQPSLIPGLPDKLLTVVGPIVAYWAFSAFFHWLDVNDYLPQYRLHTPAEVLKRNRVSRWEVVRDVVLQQVVQMAVGLLLGLTEPDDMVGKEEYDVAVWARRIRIAQRAVPGLLALAGVDAAALAGKLVEAKHATLAGAISGGAYASLAQIMTLPSGSTATVPAFALWETLVAKAMYWVLVPALQYGLAILFIDTWQYFLHRAMHMNKWLFSASPSSPTRRPCTLLTACLPATFHVRHHRLYVPYAYGALYNHPFEGFLLDTLGASLAYKLAGMNARQGLWLFTGSTFKTVDDHCGYALPWDPLQHLTANNAGYHDIHHQSWGIKVRSLYPSPPHLGFIAGACADSCPSRATSPSPSSSSGTASSARPGPAATSRPATSATAAPPRAS